MNSQAKQESPQFTRWPGISGFRVLIADDHPVVRVGVRNMLASEPVIKVIGEAGDGEEALDLAQRIHPDILLLDISMPRLSGFDVLERLSSNSPAIKVILLTASITDQQTIQALQTGARGLILKNSLTEQITDAVKAVASGAYWVNGQPISDLYPVLAALERQIERECLKPERKNYRLTPREMDVIHSIVEGCSNRDIATQFKISEETVKRHLSNIFDKTGVSTRLELAMFAIAHELVTPEF
jgi:DNA-binding NarL/FixJ family response regulator